MDGKNWSQSNITSGLFSYLYNSNGIWVACGNEGLYYSIDGKNWSQSNITNEKFSSVYNANGIWAAAGDSGLYYSVSWEPDN